MAQIFRPSTVLTALACVMPLFACGSTPGDGSAPGVPAAAGTETNGGSGGSVAGGGATASGGGAGFEASSQAGASNGGASGSGGAGDSSAYIGQIQVIRTLSPSSSLVSANFSLVVAGNTGAGCSQQTYGDCVITKCPQEPTDPGAPSVSPWQAGTLTILSDSTNQNPFAATGTPSGANGGYSFDTNGSISGGEHLTISASGGTVSAFTGQIQIPLAPLLLAPSVDAKGPFVLNVPRMQDFTLSWDARGAAQSLTLVVMAPSVTPPAPWLSCHFDAAAGTGTFQAGALGQMPAGTSIRLFAANQQAIATPEGTVGVIAAFELVSSDKAGYPSLLLE